MLKQHTKESQQEAASIALSSDLSRKQTAVDLEVGVSTLTRWIQIHRHKDDFRAPSSTDLK